MSRPSARQLAAAQHALMAQVTDDHLEISGATGLSPLLARKGAWAIYGSEENLEKDAHSHAIQEEFGVRIRRLDAAPALAREPDLSLPDGAVVLDLPDWMHIRDPGAYAGGIAAAAVEAGARILTAQVERIAPRSGGGFEIRTDDGRSVRSQKLIVAAGVWSRRFARQFDVSIPITAKRGYHLMLTQPGVQLNRPLHISHRQFMITPMSGGIRVAGTAEFAAENAPPNWQRAERLGEQAREFLPDISLSRRRRS